MLDETTHLQTCNHVHAHTFDEELVILNLERGQYYCMSEIGARAWQRLTTGASLGEAADALLEDYEVSRATLVTDLIALANEWVALGLVERRA